MGKRLFTNNALSTLAVSITSGATAMSATSGGGGLFPAITGASGDTFNVTLAHIVSGAVTAFEVVTVTARVGDAMTIVRAQEGTAAQAWGAGDVISLLPTAADLALMAQAVDVQAQAGNFAVDTGAANAYVAAVSPTLLAHKQGMPIVWKATNANNLSTGASTFNDGFATAALVTPDSAPLLPNMVRSGGTYTTIWNGTAFVLMNPSGSFGTFVATLNGVSGSHTATMSYAIQNGLATIGFGGSGNLLGPSISTSLSISGLPTFLQPNAGFPATLCITEDNGTRGISSALFAAGSGTVTFFLCTTLAGPNPLPLNAFGSYTPTGTKGLNTEFSVTYPLL